MRNDTSLRNAFIEVIRFRLFKDMYALQYLKLLKMRTNYRLPYKVVFFLLGTGNWSIWVPENIIQNAIQTH